MNSLKENTKLNINLINLVKSYIRIDPEEILKLRECAFDLIRQDVLFLLVDTVNKVLEIFTSRKLAEQYMIDHIINQNLINTNEINNNMDLIIYYELNDYNIISVYHLNQKNSIYYINDSNYSDRIIDKLTHDMSHYIYKMNKIVNPNNYQIQLDSKFNFTY
jgi:hypothetical protein